MANNKKSTTPAAQAVKTVEAAPKNLSASRIFLIVFAAVALVAILASVIVAVVVNARKKPLDYMKIDISDYVTVAEALYKNYDVEIKISEVSEFDVKNEIVKVLSDNKITPDYPVHNIKNVTISAGDVANIYYRGYILENGEKKYFDGGCNFDTSIYALEIGSGSFIPGFEYNLIGKNQKDYATMTRYTEGFTMPGDVIELTYSAYYADGTAAVTKTAIVDLSDPKLDEKWGVGFSEYFNSVKGKAIGTKFATGGTGDDKLEVDTVKTGDGIAEKDVFFDMTVNEVYRISDGKRLEVEAYFPYDYGTADLAGKTATFEVYVWTVQDYDVPAIDEKFVTETLKISAEEIAKYEGETIADKYEKYVEAKLVEQYENDVRSLIEETFWTEAIKGASFKKLPERDVEKIYREYLSDINAAYQNGYSTYYSSVDEYARAYLGLSSKDDWKAVLYSRAEYAIQQKLVFYYIVRTDNIIPSDAKYNEIYEELLEEHVLSYLESVGVKEDDEDYATKKENAEKSVLDYYDDQYWYENVLYDNFMDVIIARANKK